MRTANLDLKLNVRRFYFYESDEPKGRLEAIAEGDLGR